VVQKLGGCSPAHAIPRPVDIIGMHPVQIPSPSRFARAVANTVFSGA